MAGVDPRAQVEALVLVFIVACSVALFGVYTTAGSRPGIWEHVFARACIGCEAFLRDELRPLRQGLHVRAVAQASAATYRVETRWHFSSEVSRRLARPEG